LVRLLFLSIWRVLDPLYFSFTRLQYPCLDHREEGVFRVRLTRYKGKEVILSDGIRICKNDLLLKIHLHNVRLLRDFSYRNSELLRGRGIFKRVMESMPSLTSFILNHPEEARIKGIIGITLINKGFRPLGFDCIVPQNKYYSWFKKMMQLPIYLLSCSHISAKGIRKHHPVYLMMSKERLTERYKTRV